MKHQNKTQYNQPHLSPSSSVRHSLSDSLPKQSPIPQQTCISISIVYTIYSVDSSKNPRSTNGSKTLNRFYSRNLLSPS